MAKSKQDRQNSPFFKNVFLFAYMFIYSVRFQADVFSYGIILCEIIARIQADPDFLPRTENFGLDYHTFQHMVGDCPPDFLQLAFDCCNMDPKLRPSFPDIVRHLEEILAHLKVEEMEHERPSPKVAALLAHGFKRLNPLGFQNDKIPPKSPRPRRNIWLSRSQSDIFSCKPGRKINVQDPYYNPPTVQRASKVRKINPFTAREDLCGGKIKFYDVPSKSVFSLVFDLHSPPGSLFSNQPPIPPYCRLRGGEDGDGEAGEGKDVFGESWCPVVPSSDRDSGEVMDCSSSLQEEEGRGRGTDTICGGFGPGRPRRQQKMDFKPTRLDACTEILYE
uniref:Testis associated actin remodelling kinase 2 n=1 Tax=Acanthochromis polyacanthus TaxID=80966 RepID=A0A3Q1EIJ7_9TELE